MTNSGQHDDIITSDRARVIEKISIAVPDPDAALACIAAICADWGIRIKSTDCAEPPMDRPAETSYGPIFQTLDQLADVYETPGSKRLYSVITQHDNETNVELFSDPYQRRDALIQRINNVRESAEPLPVHLAHDDDKLATVLTALLLPDEIRLAESVWDDRSGFYRHVGFYHPISQQV